MKPWPTDDKWVEGPAHVLKIDFETVDGLGWLVGCLGQRSEDWSEAVAGGSVKVGPPIPPPEKGQCSLKPVFRGTQTRSNDICVLLRIF